MTPPRHVVLLVSSMGAGGAERVAATLSNAWVRRGDRVTLVATFAKPCRSFYPLEASIRFVSLAALPEVRGPAPLRALRRYGALRGLLRSARPDVVVSFLTNVNVKALLASAGLDVPLVVAEHTYPPAMPERWAIEALRRLTYPRAACLVMLTREGAVWAQRVFPRVRTAVIPNPIAHPMSDAEPALDPARLVPDNSRIVLSAGRFDAGKQFDHLIEAFARIVATRPAAMLVILGDGPHRPGIESLIARRGLTGRVLVPGRAGNMAAWYRRATVFAMTSRYEGFPMALGEALAHGVPAVSYDCDTGPRDMIEDGSNGLLVRPCDGVAGLAHALAALIDDPARCHAMADRAGAFRERYGVEGVLAQWDAVFEAVGRPAPDARDRAAGVGRSVHPQA